MRSMRHSTSQGRYSPSTILCGKCAQPSLQVLSCATGFYDLAFSPKRHRAAGGDTIRDSVWYHAAHDGNTDPCHVPHCDQGCTCVERHDACPLFHDRFLESHFCLAKGTILNHVTSKQALMI